MDTINGSFYFPPQYYSLSWLLNSTRTYVDEFCFWIPKALDEEPIKLKLM